MLREIAQALEALTTDLHLVLVLERTELVREVFALVVRATITIAHQHLAGLGQRIVIGPGVVIILETRAGFEVARVRAPARLLFGQYLIQIGSHSSLRKSGEA
jgi:hypothetical protein